MKGRNPTADERRFMNRICALGCIVCREFMGVHTEASPHHMEGRVKPGAHYKVLPLCGLHHQVPDTEKPARWHARHPDKTDFEKAYGTEMSLYHRCLELLEDE